jgi:molybdopterin-guanine dinucleotide biosynthesis protein A
MNTSRLPKRAADNPTAGPQPALPQPTDHISAVLLAGGQGSRMGGIDKGLVELAGRPMAAHALARLAPQVDELLINANQNRERWRTFGYPVFSDDFGGAGGFCGPLAGLQAALMRARHPLVLSVPCDSPFLPTDLVARLAHALHASAAQLAVATTAGRAHPVFCLCRRELAPQLADFLAAGGRKVGAWHSTLQVVEVPFDDDPAAFRNINTATELSAAEHDLKGHNG